MPWNRPHVRDPPLCLLWMPDEWLQPPAGGRQAPLLPLPRVSQQAVLRDEVWHWGEIPQDGGVLEVPRSYGGDGMAGETANHRGGGHVVCIMTYSPFLFPFYNSIISCPVLSVLFLFKDDWKKNLCILTVLNSPTDGWNKMG